MLEVTMFLDEDDLHQDKRMDEYIMRYLMHHGIMGASVFPAVMGYGQKHHLHHDRQCYRHFPHDFPPLRP